MKAVLAFECEHPDQKEELDVCLQAGDVLAELQAFNEALRRIYKYETNSEEVQAMVERIRAMFFDNMGEYL